MKKFFLVLILFLSVFWTPKYSHAQTSEHIQNFTSDIQIQLDGRVKFVETIVYDFGEEQRHGIFRTIEYIMTNSAGKKYVYDVQVESVADEKGETYTFSQSTENDTIKLKIGDPNAKITGIHTYKIVYTIGGAITYFSDHDEFYWDVTGNRWDVPVDKINVNIQIPPGISEDALKMNCFTGASGATEQACTASYSQNTAVYSSSRALNPYEGITVGLWLPPDIVARLEPKEFVGFWDTMTGKLTLIGLMIAAFLWYIVYPISLPIRWYLTGRDPHVGLPTSAWYDAPKTKDGRALTPSETGTLIDEKAGIQEISALLVNLAQRGYLKIVEKDKKNFTLVKQKEYKNDESLRKFENYFLTQVFGSDDTLDLKDADLAEAVSEVQKMIYEDLIKDGFFPENPDKVRKHYVVIAGLATFTFNFFLVMSCAIFGRIMPRKTLDGAQAANVARGLKNFLTSQEKQLEFQVKNQMMFEKLLPFAIAFSVEKIWAERFKDIELKKPDWYEGQNMGIIHASAFTHSLNSSLSSFRSAATPTSSTTGSSSGFSGGGSSGGGGGGGGGGSW